MQDYLFDIGITVILRVVKDSIKNPGKKALVKRALLKVRDAIDGLYAGDDGPTSLTPPAVTVG